MICKYCGKECVALSAHLKNTHKITDIKEYYDTFIKKDNEGICAACGKETTFRGLTKGYLTYCSSKCCNSAKTVIEKKKQTTKEHFGDENYRNTEQSRKTRLKKYGQFNSKECIAKIKATKQSKTAEEIHEATEKSRQTRKLRYNAWISKDAIQHIANIKLQKYRSSTYNNREKAKQTCLRKYNVTHQSKLPEIKNKIYTTRVKNNGEYWSKSIQDKIKLTKYKNFLNKLQCNDNTVHYIDCNNGFITYSCNICNMLQSNNIQFVYKRLKNNITPCINCVRLYYNSSTSNAENDIIQYIASICNEKILSNDRTVLNNKELDIYIPAKQLAIEYDGVYWHDEDHKEYNYHLQKTNECLQKHIQLIHVFEDEWLYKQNIVKSRIKCLLGCSTKIYARKCIVKTVNAIESNDFLNNNHLQGSSNSKYRYGLYYNNELVSLMTFGKSRFKKDEFELLRFCNKLNINVVGGASKLFKHFLKEHPEIKTIVSYADRRWSKGNLYEKLNFKLEGTTIPTYFYVKHGTRENRMKYQKHKLVANGADPSKTEHEIMYEKGYRRIYDCGNLKYRYIRHDA